MALLQETTGQTPICDGCGRTADGQGFPVGAQEFLVRDPNNGGDARHHYCPACAANRGFQGTPRLEFGWTPAPVPPSEPNETDEQRETRLAARGPFIPGSGEDSLDSPR